MRVCVIGAEDVGLVRGACLAVKYAVKAFLATKISFIKEIASICYRIDTDITQIAKGIELDSGVWTLNCGSTKQYHTPPL